LHAPLEVVSERVSPSAGRLERLDAQRCLLETGGHALGSLAIYIELIGVDFEVQGPPALVEHLQTLSERLARAVALTTTVR
jgi:hypothetical protein